MNTPEPTKITLDEVMREDNSVDLATELFGPRLTMAQANHRRPRKRTRAKYKGLRRKNNGRWQARITCEGRAVTLGTFDTDIEAAKVYDDAARKLFGDLAITNFPAEEKT